MTHASVGILTGHVERLALFRELMDDVEDDIDDGLPAITGRYGGASVIVVGTGMGGPVTVAGARKVRDRGARVIVRAGGAGSVADAVGTGDLIVATAGVRDEGASSAFLDLAGPAVAHPTVVRCLRTAAGGTNRDVHTGIVHSKDSFFASEVDLEGGPSPDRARQRWATWRSLGVLASDMEVAPLLAVAESYGMAAGAILRINHLVEETGGLRRVESELCSLALAGAVAAYDELQES